MGLFDIMKDVRVHMVSEACLDPIRLARFGETSTRSRLVVNGSDLGE
jgi:hypothetical protein